VIRGYQSDDPGIKVRPRNVRVYSRHAPDPAWHRSGNLTRVALPQQSDLMSDTTPAINRALASADLPSEGVATVVIDVIQRGHRTGNLALRGHSAFERLEWALALEGYTRSRKVNQHSVFLQPVPSSNPSIFLLENETVPN
jgi:hypothetical protein